MNAASDAVAAESSRWQLAPVLVGCAIAADTYVQKRRQASRTPSPTCSSPSAGSGLGCGYFVQLAIACAVYFSSGPGLIVLNKYIMTKLNFPFPVFVSALGSVSLVLTTRALSLLGLWPSSSASQVLPGSSRSPGSKSSNSTFVRIVLPLSVFTNLSLALGNSAYLYLPVPLIQILKTVTLVLVMVIGFVAGTEEFSFRLILAVATITLGIVVSIGYDFSSAGSAAGSSSSSSYAWGVLLMLFASCLEAGRAVFMQLSVQKLSFFDSIYVNSLPNCVTALLLSAVSEGSRLLEVDLSMELILALCAASILGGLVVFSTFWITKIVGGLTMKVLVNARNIGLVLFSAMVLGEPCSAEKYMGYSIALVGLGIYNRQRQGASGGSKVHAVDTRK